MGVRHAELAGLGVHHRDEALFVAAAEAFADHHGHVVGGLNHDAADRLFHRDAVAAVPARALQAKTGRRLCRGVTGSRQAGVHGQPAVVQGIEQQVERHHLGQ